MADSYVVRLVRKARRELTDDSLLHIEGRGHVAIIERALEANLDELVTDHVLRLRDILDEVHEEDLAQARRTNLFILLQMTPLYQLVERNIAEMPSGQAKDHFQNMLTKGESYGTYQSNAGQ